MAKITEQSIRLGVFFSAKELECCIMKYTETHKGDSMRVVWSAKAHLFHGKVPACCE